MVTRRNGKSWEREWTHRREPQSNLRDANRRLSFSVVPSPFPVGAAFVLLAVWELGVPGLGLGELADHVRAGQGVRARALVRDARALDAGVGAGLAELAGLVPVPVELVELAPVE